MSLGIGINYKAFTFTEPVGSYEISPPIPLEPTLVLRIICKKQIQSQLKAFCPFI